MSGVGYHDGHCVDVTLWSDMEQTCVLARDQSRTPVYTLGYFANTPYDEFTLQNSSERKTIRQSRIVGQACMAH